MFVRKSDYYEIEEFSDLGVGAIYTTMKLGDTRSIWADMGAREILKKRLGIEDKTIVFSNQTHSTNIASINDNVEGIYLETDGFITKRKDLALFTQYADCLPIYAYDKKNKVIGISHAGWRGSFDGVQKKMIEKMIGEYQSNPEDILIGLGIGISSDNYEVGEEFFEECCQKCGKNIAFEVFSIKGNKYHYDNTKLNKLILLSLGIKEENIVTSDKCTYSSEFYSFRRDKERSGRNGGFIYFK